MRKSQKHYILWVVLRETKLVVETRKGTLVELIPYINFWDDDDYELTLEVSR